ncbi:MAG: pilus assembly protein PilM [Verrucomicrobiae bacterium]|nr:pilus assembly protein PilM [Verrucomicrobiae bacterium]
MKPKTQRSLGIAFGAAGLEVAEVARNGGPSVRLLRCASFPVAPSGAAQDGSAPAGAGAPLVVEQLKSFQPARGASLASVAAGLSSSDVLCRLLSLPTVKDAELRPMLELQLENLAPLPPEQVVFGFEVLRKTETQSELLVAIARREKVVERLEQLREAGLAADVLDLNALALLEWLRQQRVLPEQELDQLALVVLEGETATLLLNHAGHPHLVMAVPLGALRGTEAEQLGQAAQLIGDELHLAQAAVQTLRPEASWPVVRVLQHSAPDTPAADLDAALLAEALEARTGATCEALALDPREQAVAVALGLCFRAVANGQGRLNLVPAEYLAERRRGALRQRLRKAAILAALIYAVALAGALSALGFQMSKLSSLESEAARMKPAFDRVSALRDDVHVLQEYVTNKSPSLEILLELLQLRPDGLFLTELTFNDGEQVSLNGYAPNASAVSEFEAKLQKSALFPGGTTMSPLTNQKTRGGEVVVKFQIQCKMKKSPHEETTRRRGKRR